MSLFTLKQSAILDMLIVFGFPPARFTISFILALLSWVVRLSVFSETLPLIASRMVTYTFCGIGGLVYSM